VSGAAKRCGGSRHQAELFERQDTKLSGSSGQDSEVVLSGSRLMQPNSPMPQPEPRVWPGVPAGTCSAAG
jgi:hypothetical protein